MKKRLVSLLLTLLYTIGVCAFAQSKPAATNKPAASRKSSGSGPKLHLGAVGRFAGGAAKRAAAVTTGFAIGTPIAAVRLMAHANGEQKEAVPFIGESKKVPLVVISRGLVAPISFFTGTVQAPVYSAMNAWQESEDNPFSKESFFLGDLESRVPQ